MAELIRHAVAQLLTRGAIEDPALLGSPVTVPFVKMSPDLKLATIFVMPLGGRDIENIVSALNRNSKFLRGEIARTINLKFAPEIRFRVDTTFEIASKMDALLNAPGVKRDLSDH